MSAVVDSTPAMHARSDEVPSVAKVPSCRNARSAQPGSNPKAEALAAAMEFSTKTDDGMNPYLWPQADLVIIGLSGMGKTPISKHLASMDFKVSNFPLVRNCTVPEELYQVDQRKVVGLMINPDVLLNIRRDRSYQWGVSLTRGDFTDYEEIEDEVKWAKRLYRRNPDWKVVNTTDRDPKDVAAKLAQFIQNGLED